MGSDRGDTSLGILHPSFAATVRPKGGHGVFTQAGTEPEFALRAGEDGPAISLPIAFGLGWSGFYEAGTGTVSYCSVGLAYSHPFVIGDAPWRFRVDGTAVIRDDPLRRIGSADAETATVAPLVTMALVTAF